MGWTAAACPGLRERKGEAIGGHLKPLPTPALDAWAALQVSLPTVALVAVVLIWAGYRYSQAQQSSSPLASSAVLGDGSASSQARGSAALDLGPITLPAGSLHATTSARATAGLVPLDEARTLQFDLCNGFTNQRIALLSGEVGGEPCRAPAARAAREASLVAPPGHCLSPSFPRCAHATGLVLAAELNRSMVLPDFLLDGYQPDAKEWITADKAQLEPFG